MILSFSVAFPRYYINYKMMKKKVKQYVQQTQTGGKNREQVLKEFSRVLDDQVQIKSILFSDLFLAILLCNLAPYQ